MTGLRTLRMMVRGIVKSPSPSEVAAAIAVGIAVGVVPKGNLLAVGLGIVMCALRLNLPVAIAVMALTSTVAHIADPLFDTVGGFVLSAELLQPLWVWFSRQPYADWTQFNHTVVAGAFLLALVQVYPTYRAALPVCERYVPALRERLLKTRLMRWWRRFEWSTRLGSAHGVG